MRKFRLLGDIDIRGSRVLPRSRTKDGSLGCPRRGASVGFEKEHAPGGVRMAPSLAPSPQLSRATALVVMLVDGDMALCPFFAKCDGVVVIDPDGGRREFHARTQPAAAAMCDLILKTGARRLVLGFVPGPAARRLRAAGVDIRLGSCACAVEQLAACFDDLPAA